MPSKKSSPLLMLTQNYAKALKMSEKDLFVAALRSMYAHVYYIWRTFKPVLGFDKALATYGTVWEALAVASFQGGMEALGLKEVNDLPTFGKIVQYCFTGVPALYEIKRNEPDEHVGHIFWCANPAYGPADLRFNRNDYYRQEIHLTYAYVRALIAEAKKAGLKEDVEFELPSGRCRDGAACACQVVLRTARGNKDRPLPEVEYRFLEDEMGIAEPILYVLRKQKRKMEDQAPLTFAGFFYTDYLAWQGLESAVAARKARDIYLELWRTFPPQWTNEARLALWMGKPESLDDLGRVLMFCENKKYMPYGVVQKNGAVVLTSELNPYVEVMNAFGVNKGCSYFDIVTQRDEDFLTQVLKEVRAEKKYEATLKSAISKGDQTNEIELRKR